MRGLSHLLVCPPQLPSSSRSFVCICSEDRPVSRTGRNNDQSIEDYVWRLCQAAANGLVPINCNDDMTPSSDSFRVVVRPAFIVLYSA
mmetsp:Transcript_23261/g.54885  ORF Transcript_23261/g.54885 Transcript_23261/m.54885 type:complete len:88 (-) Transcript_23261:1397-1660(-)